MAETKVIGDTTDESHAFRTLFRILLVVGIVAAITKFMSDRRRDFYGLTEAEARAKFESKLGPIIGEDRASDVADQVIPRLKETGVLIEDAMDKAKSTASDLADKVGDTTKEVADNAKKAASGVVDQVGDVAEKAGESVKDTAEKIGKKID